MKDEKNVRLAIIGTGGMANAHAGRFNAIEGCQMAACCDIAPGRAKTFAEKHKIPAAYENVGEMLKQEKLDGVSVVTPDRAHAETALLAIAQGLNVMCEKPLADNLKDARRMAAAARRKKLITAVNFSYRNNPATQKASEIAASGVLGKIIHVEGAYLQSWLVGKFWGDWRTADSLLWRLSTKHGSAGVLGDLGVHLFDLACFVAGEFAAVSCLLKTFDKGVKKIGKYVLDANDSAVATVRFRNGAIGTLHTTRWATGHANTVSLRVYGDRGALDLNLDRPVPDTLRVCLGEDIESRIWMPVKCPPVPDMYQRFVTALQTGKQGQTSFEGGATIQSYLDAAAVSDRKSHGFIAV